MKISQKIYIFPIAKPNLLAFQLGIKHTCALKVAKSGIALIAAHALALLRSRRVLQVAVLLTFIGLAEAVIVLAPRSVEALQAVALRLIRGRIEIARGAVVAVVDACGFFAQGARVARLALAHLLAAQSVISALSAVLALSARFLVAFLKFASLAEVSQCAITLRLSVG